MECAIVGLGIITVVLVVVSVNIWTSRHVAELMIGKTLDVCPNCGAMVASGDLVSMSYVDSSGGRHTSEICASCVGGTVAFALLHVILGVEYDVMALADAFRGNLIAVDDIRLIACNCLMQNTSAALDDDLEDVDLSSWEGLDINWGDG